MIFLLFNILTAVAITLVAWFVGDILPQLQHRRKLEKLAEESKKARQRYEETRRRYAEFAEAQSNDVTLEIRMPLWAEV